MKDKNGIEVEVGDRVRFSYTGTSTLSAVGKVVDIVGNNAHIWAVGDEASRSSWIRCVVEVIQ